MRFEIRLQMARRHVEQQEARVERQLARVERAANTGQPIEPEKFILLTMLQTLEVYRQDLRRVSRLS